MASACGCVALPVPGPGSLVSDATASTNGIAPVKAETKSSRAIFRLPPTSAEQDPLAGLAQCSQPVPQRLPHPQQASLGGAGLLSNVASDHQNFYSPESMLMLGSGFLAGGVVANTSIDDAIQRHFQASILGAESDEWYHSFHASKELGNGLYTLPVFAGAWLGGELLPESEISSKVSRWGERSLRGFAVGAPPVLALQLLIGGSRPGESTHASRWEPLGDNNGVSGHSFMGALPFITAAKLSDSRPQKVAWYSASLLAPLSRANDNAHYPSQVALGWWMAYLAATAVDTTHHSEHVWGISPYVRGDATGLVGECRF